MKDQGIIEVRGDDHDERNAAMVANSVPRQELARAEPTILGIIDHAMAQGKSPEALEQLFGLYERMEARKAKQEFDEAFAAFKRECPPVHRGTVSGQFKTTNREGQQVNRKYASLEDIERTIREPLGKHGLSYHWEDTAILDGLLTMVCVVDHAGGHSKRSPMTIPVDSKAGCSDQQKIGIAATYAQRYSLIQALGLTTCDEDTDGYAPPGQAATITEQQAGDLRAMAMEVGADEAKFLKFMKVDAWEEIPAAGYTAALKALQTKREQQEAKAR